MLNLINSNLDLSNFPLDQNLELQFNELISNVYINNNNIILNKKNDDEEIRVPIQFELFNYNRDTIVIKHPTFEENSIYKLIIKSNCNNEDVPDNPENTYLKGIGIISTNGNYLEKDLIIEFTTILSNPVVENIINIENSDSSNSLDDIDNKNLFDLRTLTQYKYDLNSNIKSINTENIKLKAKIVSNNENILNLNYVVSFDKNILTIDFNNFELPPYAYISLEFENNIITFEDNTTNNNFILEFCSYSKYNLLSVDTVKNLGIKKYLDCYDDFTIHLQILYKEEYFILKTWTNNNNNSIEDILTSVMIRNKIIEYLVNNIIYDLYQNYLTINSDKVIDDQFIQIEIRNCLSSIRKKQVALSNLIFTLLRDEYKN